MPASSAVPQKVRFSALEQRGWTHELRTIYLLDSGGWILLENALEIEQTREWKRDAARAAEGLPLTLSRVDLKDRGWTAAMIAKMLGTPQIVVPLNRTGTRVLHLFHALVVEAAETEDGFQDRVAAAARRSAAGKVVADRRADEIKRVAAVQAADLEVHAPSDLQILRARALAHQRDLYRLRGETDRDVDGADDETVARWCRNYLRHQCSSYDRLLYRLTAEFSGLPGVRDIYAEVVRPRIDALVDKAMATLLVVAPN